METFKDFLIKKHADQYHGVDDDMPDDFEQWFHFGLDRNDLIEYADEYAAIQKQEMVEEIEKLDGEFERDDESNFIKGWRAALEKIKIKILIKQ